VCQLTTPKTRHIRKYAHNPRHITTRPGEADVSQVIGVRGLKNLGGRVQEEYDKLLLSWQDAVDFYIEMRDDITISTLMSSIKLPLLAAEFNVEAASDSMVDMAARDWLWDAMNNMQHQTWRSHVQDMLDSPGFGWALGEIVLQKRKDGRLWLRNIDPRGQETLHKWEFDEFDHTTAFIQKDPDTGKIVSIPIQKAVHMTFGGRKGNPQGRGMFRVLFRTWRFLKNIENLEGIGLERNIGGMPMAELPPEPLSDDDLGNLQDALRDLRLDEEMYLIFPNGLKISAYSGSINTAPLNLVIDRKQKEILQLGFAQFIKLGMSQVGTQALVKGSQDFFTLGLVAIQQQMLEAWNGQLVPFLFRFNEFSFPGMTGFPEITWADPGKVDVDSVLAAYNTAITAKAMTPTRQDEEHFRGLLDLPDLPEGVGEEVRSVDGDGGAPSGGSPFSRDDSAADFHPGHPDQGVHAGGKFAPMTGFIGRAGDVPPALAVSNRALLSGNPDGQELLRVTDVWTDGPLGEPPKDMDVFRGEASAWLTEGTEGTDGAILAEAIASSPPTDETLFRGIALRGQTSDQVLEQFDPGSNYDIGPSSFSTDATISENFAEVGRLDTNSSSVMFEVEPGSRVFNAQAITDEAWLNNQKERVGMGRYEVLGSELDERGIVRVRLRQSNVFTDVAMAASNKLPRESFKPAPPEIDAIFRDSIRIVGQRLGIDPTRSRPSTMSSFAEEDPNLRSGGGDYENTTNRLQSQLLNIYDRWAIDTRTQILSAQEQGIAPEQFSRIIAGRVSDLETNLINAQALGITAAVGIAISQSLRNSARVQTAIAALTLTAATSIRTSLIDNIQTRLSTKLADAAGTVAFDRSTLKDIFDTNRASVASSAGLAWSGIFTALLAAGQEQEQQTGQTQRVRWVLNDAAAHCDDSPGRFGCPGQSGVYDSWAELETVPAGQVTCRGNCRCRLEVETEPGSNNWVRGLPGFNP